MKVAVLLLLFLAPILASVRYEEVDDNEFAEFDTDEDIALNVPKETAGVKAEASESDNGIEEALVEDEDSEFDHFQDEEEFEGFGDERISNNKPEQKNQEPEITIAKVPLHFRTNWDSYWLEILMVLGLIVYFLNFFAGKTKNTKIANCWFNVHKSLLDDNFTLVGDDGKMETESPGLIKESENLFTLWCSGRTCCEGMLVELKLIKRQDLVAIIAGMIRPTRDRVHIKVIMNKEDMDSFVLCAATKKTATHFAKEMNDLSVYCPKRKPGDTMGLPTSFSVMSEISEAASVVLDSRITALINKYSDMVEYIHVSDQYSGPKLQDESNANLKPPETQKVLMFGFNLPARGLAPPEACEQMKPLLIMVFYLMEKIKRYRLSKEGKAKADKNRARVEEARMKSTHAARAEAAAARREEKLRQEKEKILAEGDPEKQRKWEEKEQKRQMKKKAPKMKQLKVKAL